MNFPLEFPVFRLLFWLFDTAGVGGVLVALVGGGSITAYALTLRWIRQAAEGDEAETYTYPTPALHGHEPED